MAVGFVGPVVTAYGDLFRSASDDVKQEVVDSAEGMVDALITALRDAETETPDARRLEKVEVLARVILGSISSQDNYVNGLLLLAAVSVLRLRECQGEAS